MTYLDVDKFVTGDLLPMINDLVKEYLEDTYSYIENEDDLEDLEDAEITDEFMMQVKIAIYDLIDEVYDDYDFSKVDDKEINNELLYQIIDSSFVDYKEILIQKYNDQFDKEEYIDEYYSDMEF